MVEAGPPHPEADAPRASPCLVYQLDGQQRVFPVPEGATTLGSACDNDLILEHESVRPHQVVIMRAGEDVELRDLFAGLTRVNGLPRHSGPLRAGDLLSLGEVRLRMLHVELPGIQGGDGDLADGAHEPQPTSETGRFRRFSTREVDEEQLERSLFAGQDAEAAEDEESGTARFDPASFQAAASGQPGADPAWGLAQPLGGSSAPVGGPDTRRVLRSREARRARALARARQLSDDVREEPDFERLLERLALAFLDVFAADRAVAVLFEEDGKNPLLTVERSRDGSHQGAGVAPEIVERCLQAGTVIRVAGGDQPLDGLAAPLLTGERALGLLYFERRAAPASRGAPSPGEMEALELEDVHLMGLLANQAALVIAPLVT